ncbi:hypothetical protein MNEG_3820 [Monoraphidium neglectum]|uniref:beta-glucosidase n=1 Tax=Monoraphidium neglectum TaxID=145388 RepID=A0A0D2NGL7_9CHLO|nr:hypothetical protein MNEG_3820 [Monoraphidium neglectum]KIZ04141.1 hypothetical protein MNEG_3820 [Monoraphidium neglectum]|eukprot:XP_013903160.1 hypothetical protein MNEG_3820 [Monoraphidium neglectum]
MLEEDGWLNAKVADHFVKYAKLCFSAFGDRRVLAVKHWITFNEPWCAAVLGHDSGGQHAPGRTVDPSREVYRAAHHMLLAHSKAYDVYQRLFKRKQRGKVGIALNGDWYEPKPATDPEEARRNKLAAERAREFTVGWFARPLYQGDYPAVMRERVGNRLPRFTREQRETLKGSCDFFGLNHYSSHLCEQPTWFKDVGASKDGRNTLVRVANQLVAAMGRTDSQGELVAAEGPEADTKKEAFHDPYIESTGYWQDVSVDQSDDAAWKTTDMGWGVHPEGIRKMLNWVQDEFSPRGGIIITENGAAIPEDGVDDAVKDVERAVYLKRYLTEVHKAILNDDVDVRGYFVWSLLDNFEWGYGFTKKFGLHHVDLDTLERVPKLSARWYAEVTRRNRLDMA